MFKEVYPHCAGLDVHKKFLIACRLTLDAQGETRSERRKFGTMPLELQELAHWLAEVDCTHVAMESTGVYWQPIYNVLEGHFELFVVNAHAIARMPGRKTDMQDAEWIATLMQHGRLQPSFIPDRPQRELRDLARYRLSLVQEHSRFANRLQKVLGGTNIKLSSVVTDIQGVSAQAILRQLVNGQTDPHLLAELAKGKLRKKVPELERALAGNITPVQRQLLANLLVHLDFLDEQIAEQETKLEDQLVRMPRYREVIPLLDTIPGVDRQLAILVIAEIGIDMQRFPTDRHLTAWAGLALGNNETGGKQRSTRTRKGNKYLRTGMVLAAHGAARTKDTYLRSLYYRLAMRRGKGRAAMAVGRTIVQIAYHLISQNQPYQDLGATYLDQLDKDRTSKRLVKRLEALGFTVALSDQTITPPMPQGAPSAELQAAAT